MPIPVAAMMTASYLKQVLPGYRSAIEGADLVMVPGSVEGSLSDLRELLGVEVVKGPRHASDIQVVLELYLKGIIKLSPSEPADALVLLYMEDYERRVLEDAKKRAELDCAFKIGGMPVSKHYPLVVVEVYTMWGFEKAVRVAEHGDLVSLGVPGESKLEEVALFIEKLRLTGKPVGIDTENLDLALKLLDKVDFVNNVFVENVDWVVKAKSRLQGKPVILVAASGSVEDRVEALATMWKALREQGVNAIVDPVLKPPVLGLAESLEAYIQLKKAHPEIPVLMGVGNVTELADVDCHGLSALLAFVGVELGVELYLTTEASTKTRGCAKELRKALDMAVIARDLKKPPKDLSTSMLYLKSKRSLSVQLPRSQRVIYAEEKHKYGLDPKGYFRIHVDHDSGFIVLQHYEYGSREPSVEIRSKSAHAILKVLLEGNLASMPDHFFYLGYELAKAEVALKTGREYEQDKDLF